MADAGNALIAILKASPAVVALVTDEIYRIRLPQDPTYPAIVIELTSSPDEKTHDPGVSYVFKYFWQINIYGLDAAIVNTVYDAALAATDGQKGTFAGVNVKGLLYRDDRDMHDAEPETYRRILEEEMFIQT